MTQDYEPNKLRLLNTDTSPTINEILNQIAEAEKQFDAMTPEEQELAKQLRAYDYIDIIKPPFQMTEATKKTYEESFKKLKEYTTSLPKVVMVAPKSIHEEPEDKQKKPTNFIQKLRQKWREKKCRNDWHDYPDAIPIELGEHPTPMHFHSYTCRYCGKHFII